VHSNRKYLLRMEMLLQAAVASLIFIGCYRKAQHMNHQKSSQVTQNMLLPRGPCNH
jgi:hypothetical protein